MREKKVAKPVSSPPCGGAISQPICTKFGEFVDLTDLIMPAKFGFSSRGKNHFPFRKQTAYITVPCTSMLACDSLSSAFYMYVLPRF